MCGREALSDIKRYCGSIYMMDEVDWHGFSKYLTSPSHEGTASA
jgi:hypothetical protein